MARRVGAGTVMSPLRRRWREDRPAALRRPTPAPIELLVFRCMVLGPLVLIVVHELRPGRNGLDRLDEDPLAIVDRLAIRVARMVDEARLVPVHRSVDHRLV